ncbi:RHS repeat domain-containing protein, partial [Glycocaulis albus]|uniref:RHS repeat domain-containing protein n=1 Tax=Glycocaulis albus TaxID=1382801 RepID=UPI00166A11BF
MGHRGGVLARAELCLNGVSVRRLAGLLGALVLVLSSPAAWAQGGIAPVFSAVDERGIDLLTGQILSGTPGISIGDPSSGGLSYANSLTSSLADDWAHSVMGTVTVDGSVYTVAVGGQVETFTLSGSVFVSDQRRGATLTRTGTGAGATYTFVMRDGSTAVFALGGYQSGYAPGSLKFLITSLEHPSGEITTYHYNFLQVLQQWFGGEYQTLALVARLQSVTNNFGYQLHFSYGYNAHNILIPSHQSYEDVAHLREAWERTDSVMALNNAVDACAPSSWTCTGLTQDWPSLDIDQPSSNVRTLTDNLGRVTRYTFSGGRISSIRVPGSSSNDVSYAYNGAGRVSSITYGGSQTWTYAYSDSGGQRTTTVTSPLGHTDVLVSNLSTGLPVSSTNGVGQTTSLEHDSHGRVTKVIYPEGNEVRYAYDARGNVTEVRRVAKPGTGLPDLVTSAGYPSSCS